MGRIDRRFDFKYIDTGSCQATFVKGIGQRLTVNYGTACCVDKYRSGFHAVYAIGVNEVFSICCQRCMQGNKVGGTEEFVQRNISNALGY